MTFMVAISVAHLLIGVFGPRELSRATTYCAERCLRRAIAAVGVVTFFFAGIHKLNWTFLDIDPRVSWGARVILGTLGEFGLRPTRQLLEVSTFGVALFEAGAPIVALVSETLRVPTILALLLFQFPMISFVGAADYPFIIVAAFPALLSTSQWLSISGSMKPSLRGAVGAATAIALHFVLLQRFNALTIPGALVAALWGYAVVAIVTVLARPRNDSG